MFVPSFLQNFAKYWSDLLEKFNFHVRPHISSQVSLFFSQREVTAHVVSGIDKITEKSQVSEDGTLVALPRSSSPATPPHRGAINGASDTESNSERDHEVRQIPRCSHSVYFFAFSQFHPVIQVFTRSQTSRSRMSSVSSTAAWTANSDWVREGGFFRFISAACWFLPWDFMLYLPFPVRCCHGNLDFLCKPLCGFCKSWSLRWRRSALTSRRKVLIRSQMDLIDLQEIYKRLL